MLECAKAFPKEYVDGVTPNGYASATVTYGTKTTANMEYKWDEQSGRTISAPPIYTLFLRK